MDWLVRVTHVSQPVMEEFIKYIRANCTREREITAFGMENMTIPVALYNLPRLWGEELKEPDAVP